MYFLSSGVKRSRGVECVADDHRVKLPLGRVHGCKRSPTLATTASGFPSPTSQQQFTKAVVEFTAETALAVYP